MQRKNTRHERGGEKQKVFSTLAALFKKKHKILLSFFLFPPLRSIARNDLHYSPHPLKPTSFPNLSPFPV